MSEQKRELDYYDKIMLTLPVNQSVYSVIRVGSTVKDNNVEMVTKKDIDYLVVVPSVMSFINQVEREKEFNQYTVLDDSIRIDVRGVICNIAIYDKYDFMKKVDDILSGNIYGENREWVIGYWLPEAFLYDMHSAIIIYDPDCFMHKQQEKIIRNYDGFKNIMINRIKTEVSFMNNNYADHPLIESAINVKVRLAIIRCYNLIYNKKFKKFNDMVMGIEQDNIPLLHSIINQNGKIDFITAMAWINDYLDSNNEGGE